MSKSPRLPLLVLAACAVVSGSAAAPPPVPSSTKLKLHKWSGDLNVPDPVACTVDPQGRVYVTQTTRRKVADLDIREHTQWIPNDVALENIDQKKAFYHEVLGPGRMLRPEGGLRDHNKDGSIDWKDLTVHSERIYRLEDSDGDGTADKMTVFAEGFNTEVTGIAAGILWHDGWVYCTIAPDLWRLRDTNDDGVADEREVVAHGFGHHIAYAGHDMHGLCVGPDGRIYWSIGDKGVNVKTKEGRQVGQPHEGCVLRCEPDGSNFEIFAHGLRNVQEIAFDDFGNLFGVDNDADKTGEKERFVYITEQSDSGWRCHYQYMKGWVPWMNEGLWRPRFSSQPEYITPPLAAGHDGPAGFAFNPGTALGESWKGSFLGSQFPSGKIHVFRVEPSGASFQVIQDEQVSSGVMAIGMSWGPDGKLYLADWQGGYPLDELGAVWSVDDAAGTLSPERQETQRRLQEAFSDPEAVEPVALLGDVDQRVRRMAQFEAVKRGDFERLAGVVKNESQPRLARIHALWGLGQGMRAEKVKNAGELIDALIADKDAEIRAQLAKVIGDAKINREVAPKLIPLLKDASPRVRFHTAIALGKLKITEATGELIAMALANADKDAYLRHAAITGLVGCANSRELEAATTSFSRAVRVACLMALRRRLEQGVRGYLNDREFAIATESARAIYDDESIPEGLPELANALVSNRNWPEPFVRRSLNANFRLGGKVEAGRVLDYALRSELSDPLREEALTLLKLWSDPPPLDRVDGRARKLAPRPKEIIAEVVLPHLDDLIALKESPHKTLAVQILTTYKLPVKASVAVAAVMEAGASPEVRVEALHLLADQHAGSPEFASTLEKLATGKTPEVLRVEALEALAKLAPETIPSHAQRMLLQGSTLEKQKSISLLAAVKLPEADAMLAKELDMMVAGTCPGTRQLDVLEAAQVRAGEVPELKEKLDQFEASRAALIGTAAFGECLEGGDSKMGKEIAMEHLSANCTACHRFDGKEGSNVGPVLSGIGAEKDPAYILESLVAPTATIAPGFGMVSMTLKDRQSLADVITREDADTVEIKLGEGTVKKVGTVDRTVKTPPISVMPPMSAILTRRQIRDVVAYLKGLKSGAGAKKAPAPAAAEHGEAAADPAPDKNDAPAANARRKKGKK